MILASIDKFSPPFAFNIVILDTFISVTCHILDKKRFITSNNCSFPKSRVRAAHPFIGPNTIGHLIREFVLYFANGSTPSMICANDLPCRRFHQAVRRGITHNDSMTNHQDWHIWADQLHRLGIGDWVASLLEAAGPLTLVGAQMIYICQPFLNRAMPQNNLDSMIGLLEEPEQAQIFATYLRKERDL